MINYYSYSSFPFSESTTNNGKESIQLKWLALCFNFDFETGKTDLFMNGNRMKQNVRKPISRGDHSGKPFLVRMGQYYFDKTPLIGKLVDINMWDRLVTLVMKILMHGSYHKAAHRERAKLLHKLHILRAHNTGELGEREHQVDHHWLTHQEGGGDGRRHFLFTENYLCAHQIQNENTSYGCL